MEIWAAILAGKSKALSSCSRQAFKVHYAPVCAKRDPLSKFPQRYCSSRIDYAETCIDQHTGPYHRDEHIRLNICLGCCSVINAIANVSASHIEIGKIIASFIAKV